MEVYVDDLLVKSKEPTQHLADLREALTILCQYKIKLNMAKWAFEVGSGKFLAFIVSERGIEASPEKIDVILSMKSPKSLNDTQRLVGRVAVLNKFVFRSTNKCLPFLGYYIMCTIGMRNVTKLLRN